MEQRVSAPIEGGVQYLDVIVSEVRLQNSFGIIVQGLSHHAPGSTEVVVMMFVVGAHVQCPCPFVTCRRGRKRYFQTPAKPPDRAIPVEEKSGMDQSRSNDLSLEALLTTRQTPPCSVLCEGF
jgi:hypothetical protein